MRPFRRASATVSDRPAHGASALVIAALLGIIVGSLASLQWGQRSASPVTCATAACPTCPVALPEDDAASGTRVNEPPGGTWLPKSREHAGNAELQAVLQRVAINGEVLVAGVFHGRCVRSSGSKKPSPDALLSFSVKQCAYHA